MADWDGTRWVPQTAPASPSRRRSRFIGAAAEAALITILTFGLIAGTALAGKGDASPHGKPAGSAMELVLLDSTDGVPHHGQRITFALTTSLDKPYVNLRCHRDGALLYDGWAGYFATSWSSTEFTLSSHYWEAGAADCTSRLVSFGRNGRERQHAELSFAVQP